MSRRPLKKKALAGRKGDAARSEPGSDRPSLPKARSIERFLARRLGLSFTLEMLQGDASTRSFMRVSSGRRRAVLMAHPEPLHRDAPLFSNHRVLTAIGAPVPRLLAAEGRTGLVLVEDLGDLTLQQHLLRLPPGPRTARARAALYREACEMIVLLHRRGEAALLPGDFAARHALDQDRFLFELDHFHRHYLLGLRELRPTGQDEAALRSFYADLAGACDRLPRVYCHRDFQSRNLMVHRGRLRLIDFQDARMGPYTYDAASLLRDSSLDLQQELVQHCLGMLADRLGVGLAELRRDFDLMALQRNIKDLGTFGYMATVKNRPGYLAYVPRTVRMIRRTLVASRRHHILYPILERFILAGRAA